MAPFRGELLAHCYRMLGSLADAEDALQDSLVRAWHGLAGFEGRTSLRRWLYKVATNACLTAIERRQARSLPHLEVPAGEPGDLANVEIERWLEPFPDALIAVLRDDAIASMPPSALWVRGRPAIVACMRALVWTGGALRLVRTAANDAPAFGVYQDRGGTLAFAALGVVEIEAGGIAAVHSFLASEPRFSPARYGLPAALDTRR